MTFDELTAEAESFSARLQQVKAETRTVDWYPYGSMSNFDNFKRFTQETRDSMFAKVNGMRVADIGAADGDTAFFFSSLGAKVSIIDNQSTNYNDCKGIKYLQARLDTSVRLIERDLDFSTDPMGEFDFAFFLGILYHLRNPMMALISLAESAEYMVVSTAIISRLEPNGESVEDREIAALLPRRQINDDPTNYWYMTPYSFRVLLNRCGWTILDEFRTGDIGLATPKSGDERIFAYCRRAESWRDLRRHHDF